MHLGILTLIVISTSVNKLNIGSFNLDYDHNYCNQGQVSLNSTI
mgnify:FL=1